MVGADGGGANPVETTAMWASDGGVGPAGTGRCWVLEPAAIDVGTSH